MKKLLFTLASFFLFIAGRSQTAPGANAIYWNKFTSSENFEASLFSGSKPLQYNNELDAVTFLHRKSNTYMASPLPLATASTGVVVAMVMTGSSYLWDSTCTWNNNTNPAISCQGGIYNPPGNRDISNAYIVGSGATADAGGAITGNWYAGKKAGSANYNNIAAGQQFLPNTPQNPILGVSRSSHYSFSSTTDGLVRSIAEFGFFPAAGSASVTGAVVLKGTYSANTFVWVGDTIICPAATAGNGKKVMFNEPRMAWSEDGSVGYVMFIGSRSGATLSNKGMQPIVFKTVNSGRLWSLLPGFDFNAPVAEPIKKHMPAVYNATVANALVIPSFNTDEGIDMIVDRNNTLHIAGLMTGAGSAAVDSVAFTYRHGLAGYDYLWQHTAGRRPYLYDFTCDVNGAWNYFLIDSLSSEGTGLAPAGPGYSENPWHTTALSASKAPVGSRIQLSRTPNGEYIIYTWAESDTLLTPGHKKWNTRPDIKVRLLEVATQSLSSTKLNITAGYTGVQSQATLHFISPKAMPEIQGQGVQISLPVTVSNNQDLDLSLPCDHWYGNVIMHFSTAAHPLGIAESKPASTAIRVYPNPASGHLAIAHTFKTNAAVAVFMDMNGREVTRIRLAPASNTLDISELKNGIYFLQLFDNDKLVDVQKIVKD